MIRWNVSITDVTSAPEPETEVKVSIQMCGEEASFPVPFRKIRQGLGTMLW